ncbi:hypothetical protein JYU34_016501 [Plutella xylostella]|uniref:NAD(+) ADP-ribosyltransferase n=1 Tax=Plutella xylostella TaxID=51655 RepID=A0ABQ7Q3Q2_PLUXY|nr:hypothetical protein JYU34_016501 [Plutella xylostella]
MSPIEAHYLKLKTRIEPVARGGAEFQMLEQYVRNTHAATHSQYTLEIQEVIDFFVIFQDILYSCSGVAVLGTLEVQRVSTNVRLSSAVLLALLQYNSGPTERKCLRRSI